jgi:hypothetical protein
MAVISLTPDNFSPATIHAGDADVVTQEPCMQLACLHQSPDAARYC